MGLNKQANKFVFKIVISECLTPSLYIDPRSRIPEGVEWGNKYKIFSTAIFIRIATKSHQRQIITFGGVILYWVVHQGHDTVISGSFQRQTEYRLVTNIPVACGMVWNYG